MLPPLILPVLRVHGIDNVQYQLAITRAKAITIRIDSPRRCRRVVVLPRIMIAIVYDPLVIVIVVVES
jgi:hypothetical protein